MKKLVTSILCTVMCVGIFAISTNAESKKTVSLYPENEIPARHDRNGLLCADRRTWRISDLCDYPVDLNNMIYLWRQTDE